VNRGIIYRVAYRIVVASLVVCLLLVVGMLLERTGFIELDEKAIQPEVVSCQIGHKDMEVRVLGARAAYRGEVVPRYEFWALMGRLWLRWIIQGSSSRPVCRLATISP
jgi:hypothetical protein